MERGLTRRCRRAVRVAEFVAPEAADARALRTGGAAAATLDGKTPLFAGFVEVLHARNAWLAVRVDIWTSRDACYRQGADAAAEDKTITLACIPFTFVFVLPLFAVKSSSVYLHEGLTGEDVAVQAANGDAMATLQKVKRLELNVSTRGDELPALSVDELTAILEEVGQQLVEAFQAVQVQVS
ncbi:unnamed protein product [Phytophthora lilii]|uniref:Unnamed protein product n=1 Tax=Phytophthora lilii TaxID=2077276 RepID=A0A9W7D9R1_9STRA|nr:unnamed protein product [Phytophthora lilii]